MRGTVKIVYLTELSPGRLIAASMWIDRETHPDATGLFNPETEGCVPMYILLADSEDGGKSWSSWREVPMPEMIGPASLTNPIMQLADGTLVMTIENNKHYHDASKWYQRVVCLSLYGPGKDVGRTGDHRVRSDGPDLQLGPASCRGAGR